MCSRIVTTFERKFGININTIDTMMKHFYAVAAVVCAYMNRYFLFFLLSVSLSLALEIGGQRVKVVATSQRPPPLHATIKFTQNIILLFIHGHNCVV